MKGIRYRPIRGWLTILGVVIGIMLVVIILSLGSGIQNAVSQQLQRFGTDLIIIYPGKDTTPIAGLIGGQKFREKDITDLKQIAGVRLVVPLEHAAMNVEHKGKKETTMISAAPWSGLSVTLEESQGVRLAKGTWPRDEEANEIVLGHLVANELFKNPVQIGDEIIVKSKRMTVVGVITTIGNRIDDNTIYVSLETFRILTGTRAGVSSALVKVEAGADIDLVARQIRFQLSKQEVIRDFSILTPAKAVNVIGGVLNIVELVLVIIALISLIVGAVGIMNTMYTSVLERTKQIGVMKAIGASNDAILSLFLIESGMIGIVGGILGIIFGVASAYFIGLIAESQGSCPTRVYST